MDNIDLNDPNVQAAVENAALIERAVKQVRERKP